MTEMIVDCLLTSSCLLSRAIVCCGHDYCLSRAIDCCQVRRYEIVEDDEIEQCRYKVLENSSKFLSSLDLV